MTSTFDTLAAPAAEPGRRSAAAAALAAASVSIPHALGLGLLAFAPLAGQANVAALALWSAALPSALLALVAGRPGVIHAPTTVVALLFAAVLATVGKAAAGLHLDAAQVLGVAGATAALAFGFQWLLGALRMASLARFLPIPVAHGFAAGVGLSMVVGQLRSGFGAGGWADPLGAAQHAAIAALVVVLAVVLQRRWRHMPGLLAAVAAVALAAAALGWTQALHPAVATSAFGWPAVPDHAGVPWLPLLQQHGVQLVSLALLMAIVNSLDVVVFNQELALQHGVRGDADAALRRESLLGVLCALAGLIPASTSASRSRLALARGGPTLETSRLHAALMLGVAATGHLWLPWVPMAALAGGLLLAGWTQVPAVLWSRGYARTATTTWLQSWLVALVFALAGGMGALVAGLVVATFVLLHASASTALRRALLDGQLRSRRLRSAPAEAWLAGRMDQVAVFELQGVMSFGVAAHVAQQVRDALQPRHAHVLLDAARVPAWDATALAQLRALCRDLCLQGRQVLVCALAARALPLAGEELALAADLDRALEWAEDALLAQRPHSADPGPGQPLGEACAGLGEAALRDLAALLRVDVLPPHARLFAAGDRDTDLVVVRSGRLTIATAWPPATGLRLATIGRGMACGEMAFLDGQPRTACAGTEQQGAELARLSREDFDAWARRHPQDALQVLRNLAQVGTRRLAATTRHLRAVLE